MTKLPILYSFVRCPYAIRARLAIAYAGINYEHREVRLREKPDALLEASPKGTVPVLVLPDGRVLEESLDIMYWAVKQNDPNSWLPTSLEQEVQVKALLDENDGPFKHNLDRYKYPDRYPEEAQSAEYFRDRCVETLNKLEVLLKKNTCLIGDTPTFVDFALFPFIRQFARHDLDWFNQSLITRVKEWFHCFSESKLFLSVMKKYKPWQLQDSPIFIGSSY